MSLGSTPKAIMASAAYRYAEDVLGGKILAPRTIKQQAQHFLDDLKRAERGNWRYTFDLDIGRRPVRFCEQFLLPTAGDYDIFRYMPWQEFVDVQAFGWVDRKTGYRRYREVLEFVGRGNGKTARNSGKMGYMSTKGGDRGAENYFTANSGKQAKRFYREFYGQMSMSPILRKQLRLRRAETWYEPAFTLITYLTNDPDTLDGLRPYFVIKDELEAEISFDQINQILRPMKKRRQPLMWYTGTAGTVLDGPMVYHYNYAKKILERDSELSERQIDTYLPIIYEIDPELPYEDPQYWIMANPSIGVLLDIEELLLDWDRAQRSPRERVDFVTKQLNRFAMRPEAVYIDLETMRRNDLAEMEIGLLQPDAWGGFDLSRSEDLSSSGIVCDLPDGRIGHRVHTWVPEDKIRRGNGKETKDWAEWERRGWLTVVPGHYVKYDNMVSWFKEQAHFFNIRAIGYDPYNSTELVRALSAEGFRLIEVRQGPITFNAPMKSYKELMLDGQILWEHNEMFSWYLRNVRLRNDFFDIEKENWYPSKKDSRSMKIDGFMAVMNGYIVRLDERDMFSFDEDSHVIGGSLLA